MLATLAFLTLFSSNAHAAVRPIFVGDKLILMMQGVTPSGMGKFDPEPRELYNQIALPAEDGPGGGGKGKVVDTFDKDFSLACGEKGATYENVMCNIFVKVSPRSKVSQRESLAEIEITDPEAYTIYQKLAGYTATAPFLWESKSKWIRIESTPDRFFFRFKQAP